MQESIFIIYYIFLTFGIIVGIFRFKIFDSAMRIVLLWLLIIAIAELITYTLLKTEQHAQKYLVFHSSSIVELILVSSYFLKIFCQKKHFLKAMICNAILWPTLGILNIIYLQPISQINTNMLMLESLCIITMSLYFIYRVLKNDSVINIFANPHFWIWVLWLILWSTTFFFWAFIRILYRSQWEHVNTIMNLQAFINLIVYTGIAFTLLFYSKKNYSFDHS